MPGGELYRSDLHQAMIADSYDYMLDAEEYGKEPDIIEKLAEVKRTDKAWEQSTSLIEASDPVEREEGEAMEPNKPVEGYTTYAKIRNYYKCVSVSAETLKDTQKLKNFMQALTKNWREDMTRGRNKYLMNYINYGAYTAGHVTFNNRITGNCPAPNGNLCYDLKPLFNLSGNNRSSIAGGTYYNSISGTLTPANFETLWNLMTVTNAKNEDDTEVTITPDLLLTGGTLNFTARRLLQSTLIPGSSANDKNVLEGIVDHLGTNLFSDADGYVLMQAKKAFWFYISELYEIDAFYDNKTKMHYMTIEDRYGNMVKNFRFLGSAQLPTSA